jgi:signal transduction histidine kinase
VPESLRPAPGPDRLARLLEVGRSLVSELDVEAVFRSVLDAARDLTGARYAAIGVLGSDGELERFVTAGIDEATHAAIGDLPRGRGILGLLIEDPRPLRLADVGTHPRSYGFPLNHPPMRTFLGVPLIVRGQAWGNLYLTEKQEGEFDEADEETILVLADWAATAISNANLYRAEQSRRAELERAVAALETSIEIARAVGGETRLDRVLELIAKRSRALVSARSMVILLVDGDELVVTAVAGDDTEGLVGTRIPLEASAGGQVLRSRRAERLAETRSRVRLGVRGPPGSSAGLLVPMVFQGRSVGVFEAFDRLEDGPEFDSEDERLLTAFAATAATAVATAQDVARLGLRRSIEASELERSRWARELHDDTLQELAALKIALGSTRRRARDEGVRTDIDAALQQLDVAIRGLRGIVSDLRPAALDVLGVQAALESLVERLGVRTEAAIRLHVDLSGPRLPPAVESAIYRIVQEAVTNALKHGAPAHVDVELRRADAHVTLRVTDDGAGFDPDLPGSGFGLIGMRERVALANGTLELESGPGSGTTLRVTLPAAEVEPDAPDVSDTA